MKVLLIFDSYIKVSSVSRLYKNHNISSLTLFPLTQNPNIIGKLKETTAIYGTGSAYSLNSAKLIDEQVSCLRKGITKWSSDIGEMKVGNKSIKEWLLLPKYGISTWWFGLLSEKNTFKTDIFLKIAQAHAAKNVLEKKRYDFLALAIADKDLKLSLKNIAVKLQVQTIMLPVHRDNNLEVKLRKIKKKISVAGDFLSGGISCIQFLKRKYMVRLSLGPLSKRLPTSKSLLFVSYFPAVEKSAAQKGILRNKYALVLQDKLKDIGIPITWLFMYVPLDGYNFKNAVKLAGVFVKNGEKLFILEEFLTVADAAKSLFLWLKQIILSFYLFSRANKNYLTSGIVGDECEPMVRSLWNTSFSGSNGIHGILYYFIYRNVFRKIAHIKDCLYFCEMHAWEKALNAAKKKESPSIKTIGFQHAAVSKNYFHFFYEPGELSQTSRDTDMPLPDFLACNGKLMHLLLKESGYPNLVQVESVRYIYLDKILSSEVKARKKKPVLLVTGSIDKTESINLIALVNAAFPSADTYDIWFKGHPSMPFEELFKETNINLSETGYVICHDGLPEKLSESWAVLVGSSTVAVEAMVFGCEVITPVFPDSMLKSPIADYEEYYHKVSCAEDLRATMEIIASGYSLHNIKKYRQFVGEYWDVNRDLQRWTDLLTG